MLYEIGSHYEKADLQPLQNEFAFGCDQAFLLSGRTAIDYVIRNIKDKRKLETVLLPSYCCYTMVEPFLRHGIRTTFYSVQIGKDGWEMIFPQEGAPDAVLLMQYFGFCDKAILKIADMWKKQGVVVIEDATHSFFSGLPYTGFSDYVYCSFRKWTGIECGAIAFSQASVFSLPKPPKIKEEYMALVRSAMEAKRKYLSGQIPAKDHLPLFAKAEDVLQADYWDYGVDADVVFGIEHLDVEKIKKKRQHNARILIEGLRWIPEVRSVKTSISEDDCPLCVPVVIENGVRDSLRGYLIKEGIYCPIHWPEPGQVLLSSETKNLYKQTLSLVCDQRYEEDDMKHILTTIKDFFSQEHSKNC